MAMTIALEVPRDLQTRQPLIELDGVEVKVVGGSAAACGHGARSDAPFHAGESVTVGSVAVAVVAFPGLNLRVRVTVR